MSRQNKNIHEKKEAVSYSEDNVSTNSTGIESKVDGITITEEKQESEVKDTVYKEEDEQECTVNDISVMSDEDIIKFMRDRREKEAEKVAIKQVNVPMHILIKQSAVIPKFTENEMAMQGRLNHLQNRLNILEKK